MKQWNGSGFLAAVSAENHARLMEKAAAIDDVFVVWAKRARRKADRLKAGLAEADRKRFDGMHWSYVWK